MKAKACFSRTITPEKVLELYKLVLDFVVWPETMVGNRKQPDDHTAVDILEKLKAVQTIDSGYKPFGDGNSGDTIVDSRFRGMSTMQLKTLFKDVPDKEKVLLDCIVWMN